MSPCEHSGISISSVGTGEYDYHNHTPSAARVATPTALRKISFQLRSQLLFSQSGPNLQSLAFSERPSRRRRRLIPARLFAWGMHKRGRLPI